MLKKAFAYIQYALPQHLLSTLMGWIAESRQPWLKNLLIRRFIQHYKVDMSVARIENPESYPSFNSFFIRHIKPELRPIASEQQAIACPVDGTVAASGKIGKNQIFQAKGFNYNLDSLLGGDHELAKTFYDGSFATIYLAPYNYHRVHMPVSGKLNKVIFVPGSLFSVNRTTSEFIPNLYTRNERLISIFDTEAGPMAVILVGAMIVGSIQTVWMKQPLRTPHIHTETMIENITLEKGAELGYFKMGSTVILLFENDKAAWKPILTPNTPVKLGLSIGNLQ